MGTCDERARLCFFRDCHPDFGNPKCIGPLYIEHEYAQGRDRYACEHHWHCLQLKMRRSYSWGRHEFVKLTGVSNDTGIITDLTERLLLANLRIVDLQSELKAADEKRDKAMTRVWELESDKAERHIAEK